MRQIIINKILAYITNEKCTSGRYRNAYILFLNFDMKMPLKIDEKKQLVEIITEDKLNQLDEDKLILLFEQICLRAYIQM